MNDGNVPAPGPISLARESKPELLRATASTAAEILLTILASIAASFEGLLPSHHHAHPHRRGIMSIMSRMATLARAELAMAMTVADGMQRLAVVSAKYGETLLGAAGAVTREPSDTRMLGWDKAAAQALAGYRDYVRELAALPGIASMHYYEQLGRIRTKAGAKSDMPPEPVPPPTSSMLALAAEIAASPTPPLGKQPEPPPLAQP
jgi:hypothetical protein